MSKVVVMDHPLIQHKIGIMRRYRFQGFPYTCKRGCNVRVL
jgi:uracil phosphoribosyltransferase